MRRKLGAVLLGLALALPAAVAAPARGDNEPCKGSCEGKQGDCREVEEGGHCEDNDLSPTFDDSPVRDSFNFSPTVCLPGATCHVEGQPT